MSETHSEIAYGDSRKHFDGMAFTSLLPVLYLVLLAGVFCWFSIPKVQIVLFLAAWFVAAVLILRIQQLIEHYSHGSYPYQAGLCAFLLALVVVGPWLWLFTLELLFDFLVKYGLIANTYDTWVCSFTIGATIISLMAVSPMVEGWYELLRGSFAFDGSRVKPSRPSFWPQLLLFALFTGIQLLPMTLASNHLSYSINQSDTGYIVTGFFSTYLALIWLVHQLERIREAQLSLHSIPHSPVDKSLLKRSSPLSAMFKSAHRPHHLASIPRVRHLALHPPPPLSYAAALKCEPDNENIS